METLVFYVLSGRIAAQLTATARILLDCDRFHLELQPPRHANFCRRQASYTAPRYLTVAYDTSIKVEGAEILPSVRIANIFLPSIHTQTPGASPISLISPIYFGRTRPTLSGQLHHKHQHQAKAIRTLSPTTNCRVPCKRHRRQPSPNQATVLTGSTAGTNLCARTPLPAASPMSLGRALPNVEFAPFMTGTLRSRPSALHCKGLFCRKAA
ncbi:hypothetical protein LXA43DRAFT_212469 [Ganoderma leucocontextum]|nr:hypothetical protein LXA43DRAFT_212469 [Ganoderma leucocontextum]